jgi:hypothetical protein
MAAWFTNEFASPFPMPTSDKACWATYYNNADSKNPYFKHLDGCNPDLMLVGHNHDFRRCKLAAPILSSGRRIIWRGCGFLLCAKERGGRVPASAIIRASPRFYAVGDWGRPRWRVLTR